MTNNISITINGKRILTQEGKTILEVCNDNNIYVPTLCYKEDISVYGVCRICVCEITGSEYLRSACSTIIEPEMNINTNSKKVRLARKTNLALMLSSCDDDCKFCSKNLNCELQEIISIIDPGKINLPKNKPRVIEENENNYIIRNPDKCIKCRRCIRVCDEIQQIEAIKSIYRGKKYEISDLYYLNLGEAPCVNCGQCVIHCPTEALKEKSYIDEVWKALDDPSKHVVIQVAPSIRVSLGNEFTKQSQEIETEQIVTALKEIGFDAVLDTSFGADLTIVEECNEFISKLTNLYKNGNNEPFPLFSSCCPSWVKYAEQNQYHLINYLSSCKSPQQMMGSLIKTYYAKKNNINPEDIVSVSVMPCIAKKFESNRFEQLVDGIKTVDYSLTNREISTIMRQSFIDFSQLDKTPFDQLMGKASSSGVIFGNTGGVTEALIRNFCETIINSSFEACNIQEYSEVNIDNLKTFSLTITNPREEYSYLDGITLNFAICQGLNNIKQLIDMVIEKNIVFHFVEVMSCPGGCVGGGGQTLPYNQETIASRIKALYEESKTKDFIVSKSNPELIALYNDYLIEPGSEKAKHLLHTIYTERGLF